HRLARARTGLPRRRMDEGAAPPGARRAPSASGQRARAGRGWHRGGDPGASRGRDAPEVPPGRAPRRARRRQRWYVLGRRHGLGVGRARQRAGDAGGRRMTERVFLDPTGEREPGERPRAPRLGTLAGRTIALLDIAKPRGDVFLDRLAARLEAGGASIRRYTKPTFTKPAPI